MVVLQTTQEFKGNMETLFLETCKRWLEEIEFVDRKGGGLAGFNHSFSMWQRRLTLEGRSRGRKRGCLSAQTKDKDALS